MWPQRGPLPVTIDSRIGGSPVTTLTDRYVPTLLRVTATSAAGTTRLRLAGELDAATAGQLTGMVRSVPVSPLRLDLSGLTFLDAAGLTGLLQVRALVRARDGRLVLDRPAPPVLRVLELTGMTGAFDINAR